jgi:hypothetical protein
VVIDYSVGGKGLWEDEEARAAGEKPFMIVRCIVRGACGCWVTCGRLMHNFEQGVSWHPCEAHKVEVPGNPQVRFMESLTANPMPVPVEEVIDGYLQPEFDWSPGDVIHAEPDGTIVLDDGITTFNPVRARAHLWED